MNVLIFAKRQFRTLIFLLPLPTFNSKIEHSNKVSRVEENRGGREVKRGRGERGHIEKKKNVLTPVPVSIPRALTIPFAVAVVAPVPLIAAVAPVVPPVVPPKE